MSWSGPPRPGYGNNRGDRPSALFVDQLGNVYVTGKSDSGGTDTGYDHYDYVTLKYDVNGNLLWAKRYGDPGVPNQVDVDEGIDVVVDPSGNVYVTGTIYSAPSQYQDSKWATLKYDPNGTLLWEQFYGDVPTSGGGNGVYDMVWDTTAGNFFIYVAGDAFYSSLNDYRGTVIKYDESGNVVWNTTLPFTIKAIVVDPQGNLVVFSGSYTAKLSGSDGSILWTQNAGGNDLVVDANGNIYITTSRWIGGDNASDVVTQKYSSDGVFQWETLLDYPYDPNPGYYEVGYRLLTNDATNSLYVVAEHQYNWGYGGSLPDYLLIKYGNALVGGEEEILPPKTGKEIPFPEIVFAPSFFKDKIVLKIASPASSWRGVYPASSWRGNDIPLKISLYNASGTSVFESVINHTATITISDEKISKLPSGVYFLSVYSGKRKIGQVKLIHPVR